MPGNRDASGDGILDLFVIGGGVNGCGIARDAAGRGLGVALAEMDDLGSGTSGASTKLFHGGLRYLEYFELRLVREALAEREVLLRAMPHIAWPLRFVLPLRPGMRFEAGTPASRLLGALMPWMRGRRPAWMIRFGLFLYDRIGGRTILPGTATLDLARDAAGAPLRERFRKAYEYSDCWVQDSRLVALNARDAAERGASIMTRTRVVSAECVDGLWEIVLDSGGARRRVRARILVNAAGPWAGDVISSVVRSNSRENLRLVRGSHIVVRRLYDHDRCYILQGRDGRVVFAIPFEDDFTLIGTTDEDHPDHDAPPACTDAERQYLIDVASEYFRAPLSAEDVVWTFSGLRPLRDDGAGAAAAATRDYVIETDESGGAPLVNIIGGKITTYRKLAEAAMERIAPFAGDCGGPWTAGAPLPGGDFEVDGAEALVSDLRGEHPFLDGRWARRLVRAYGTDARRILEGARSAGDLGEDFGATVTAREVDWTVRREWVRCADDFLWRRTKLGLRLDAGQVAALEEYIAAAVREEPESA